MEVVLTFVKNYFVLMLIFYLLSYLTPKETYQKYFHFFVSVLVITVLAQPLLVYVGGMKKEEAKQNNASSQTTTGEQSAETPETPQETAEE